MSPVIRALAMLVLAFGLVGCQTVQGVGTRLERAVDKVMGSKGQRLDPWESWNRKVFAFNEKLDDKVLKPVATAYADVVPAPVRQGIDNFFGNIGDVWTSVNNLLQGKIEDGLSDFARFTLNSTLGIGGLFDIASEAKIPKHKEDFGQTLGRWGVPTGPYVVLPFLGPSTLRDSVGYFADRQASPSVLPGADAERYAITALELLNTRTNLLQAGNFVDSVALDKYSFLRDAYLSRRRDALYDGAPPMETFDDEPESPAAKPAAAAASAAAPAKPASAAR